VAPDLDVWEGILRLLLSVGCAGAIGVEREWRDQEAGLRTHILVGMGSCLFVLVGAFAWQDIDVSKAGGLSIDPSRVVSYVVTGIGFLGAGAILKEGLSVTGLTTAASLWVTAAVGVAIGTGEYLWSLVGTALLLLSLWPLGRVSQAIVKSRDDNLRIVVELDPDGRVADLASAIEADGSSIRSISIDEGAEMRTVNLVVVSPSGGATLLDAITTVHGVRRSGVAS
jgi:putative Mg2+ transporter-C (MgtC) family protein